MQAAATLPVPSAGPSASPTSTTSPPTKRTRRAAASRMALTSWGKSPPTTGVPVEGAKAGSTTSMSSESHARAPLGIPSKNAPKAPARTPSTPS